MKDSTFTIDQIVALRELERSRQKQGRPGFREEVQSLLQRLGIDDESGGRELSRYHNLIRTGQATILFDRGFGEAFKSYEDYLATIPEIPEKLKELDERFPTLVLVDARLGITKSCKLAGLKYTGDDQTFEDFDPKKVRTEKTYWMRCQDGRKNSGKPVTICRRSFATDEFGLTAMEGIALYVLNPEVVTKGYFLNLAGSVSRDDRGRVAFLGDELGELALSWNYDDSPAPGYGSASRLE